MSGASRLTRPFEDGLLDVPPEGTIRYLRAEPGPVLDLLPRDRLDCRQGFRPIAAALERMGYGPRGGEPAAMTLVTLTRHRAEARGLIAEAHAGTAPGGAVVISGDKTAGVDAILKELKALVPLEGVIAKAHGKVAWYRRGDPTPPAFADWAAAMTLSPNADGLLTAPGMFSSEGIDAGSALLADHLPPKMGARVADLGAGWGWLAHRALEASPGIEELHLFEAEARALDAARANVTDPRARFHWADVTDLPKSEPFDTVLCNPPFHEGRAADPALGIAFIEAARRMLKPGGALILVANRHLPYEAPLDAAFQRVTRLAETGRFKLYRAEKPRKPGRAAPAR